MLSVDWPRALAFRLGRQLLDPVGQEPVEGVVARLGAVPAQTDAGAELAVRSRRQVSEAGEVARALAEGRLIKTFAFRGATHLVTPETGGDCLSLRGASRMWELPSWREHYRLEPSDWPAFRAAVRSALAGGPLAIDELGAAVGRDAAFAVAGARLRAGAWTLVKALAWQGDLAFGPSRGGRPTLAALAANPRWAGIPQVEDAGPRAVETYLRAYGPATPAHLHYWLGEGLGAGRKRIEAWLAGLGDRLVTVDVDGGSALVLREDLDELAAARPSGAVRFLPAADPWLMGPGTADPHVVPPARRSRFSRQANPVIKGGVVVGAWAMDADRVAVEWFAEAGPPPGDALAREAERLGAILGRAAGLVVRTT